MEIVTTLISAAITVARLMDGSYEATGVYQYSPNISQVEACRRAEEKAKLAILQKAVGHEFTADKITSCSESNDNMSCRYYDTSYEATRGYIKNVKDRKEVVKDWTCSVTVQATVGETVSKINPQFDMMVKMPRGVYGPEDFLDFEVIPNDFGYVYAYIYTPSENKLRRVFPNRFDSALAKPHVPFKIPSRDYKIKLYTDRNNDEQYLFVMFIGHYINALETYDLNSFYNVWDNLTTTRKRLIKRGFVITR